MPFKSLSLLSHRTFGPYFYVQFLGALNDNLYKNALIILIAFSATIGDAQTHVLINLCAALFILPFFLFSAYAGKLADAGDKIQLIQQLKLLEVGIMLCASAAFWLESIPALIALLFLMGTQSAFFGPVKYAILPEHLSGQQLTAGNAFVEAATFIAILIGTLASALIINTNDGILTITMIIIGVASIGYYASLRIPPTSKRHLTTKNSFHPWRDTQSVIALSRKDKPIFTHILAISWFWFIGASYLTQLPAWTQQHLNGNEQLLALLLVLFSSGIGIGSLFCTRLKRQHLLAGLTPVGAIGMSVFGGDLSLTPSLNTLTPLSFLSHMQGWRITADILLLGISAGLYIVPLYLYIQRNSPREQCSQHFATTNIINAAFMVVSALFAMIFLALTPEISQLFLIISCLNIAICYTLHRRYTNQWDTFKRLFT